MTPVPDRGPAPAPSSLSPGLLDLGRRVELRLPELLPPADQRPEAVHQAMRYALTSPGKRLRPILTLVVAELFGSGSERSGRSTRVLDIACGIEMVHACSLILDDLPAMDDAGVRRGRPTVHRAFGEAVALLAALALLNRAYALVAEAAHHLPLQRYTAEDMIHHLAAAIGSHGLIGGQALDLASLPEELDLERLEYIHSHKTGALFMAAGELGAMAADAKRRELELVARYAKNLGLAFQISDDLLDVLSTPEEAGKDVGQDTNKVTFVKRLGVAGAQTLEAELLGFAVASLEPLGKKAEPLREIARFVQHRKR
ncbi:MAG TPA: polyprenyl synthetase family protein [Thermoanaerobaculia bacterium]|jgi:geranylgeranyl diphosphate synthase type II|nr:polyprenyl synthetase family protein [Thermoanaerobaculia bacterium]